MPRNEQYTCPQPSVNGAGTSRSWSSGHHGDRAVGWWPEWLRNADRGYVGKSARSGDGRRPKHTSGFRWTQGNKPALSHPSCLPAPWEVPTQVSEDGLEQPLSTSLPSELQGGFEERTDKSNVCRRSRAQTPRKPNPTEARTPAGPRSPSPQKALPHICNGWSGGWSCSSFSLEKNKQTRRAKPRNLQACNRFCCIGLFHQKTGCEAGSRQPRGHGGDEARLARESRPVVWTTIKENAWVILKSIWDVIRKNKYHPDLQRPPSHAARSLWWWRQSGPAPPRAPKWSASAKQQVSAHDTRACSVVSLWSFGL